MNIHSLLYALLVGGIREAVVLVHNKDLCSVV